MKRRAAVEPGIGNLKNEHRLERNRLWGEQGDMINVILSAAGMNFHKLLRHAAAFWRILLQPLVLSIRPSTHLNISLYPAFYQLAT